MINLKELEVWFITGSQDLYGPKVLEQVANQLERDCRLF